MTTNDAHSPEQYVCAMCGGKFDKAWSDEEATAELGDNFPGFSVEECDVVCDDCYKGFARYE